ncbi:hypothetical protein [Phyllobacterium chamaecytisi]|uniref:hypothetical protein n=1 Tax=Phyllobacterium chamaecytisi TaxID=2876082 RepID=UPI001CCC0257|nr:hypothetical protein [Phyllobacterium sp. KW56]MBZ9603956.1 hypothetical protein [Phyllobacterium sp. KW56]
MKITRRRSSHDRGGTSDIPEDGFGRTRVPGIGIFSVFAGKISMTLPEPPNDLSRGERKIFRTMVKRLVERGIDPVSRAGLVEDYARTEERLKHLRTSEKQADSASKMAVTRAVNVATAERRRLHDAMFRGAGKPAPMPVAQQAAQERSEADEAWRDRHWQRVPNPLSQEELGRRYGRPRMAALLYRSIEEEIGTKRILKKYGHKIPSSEWDALRAQCGGRLQNERHDTSNFTKRKSG